MRESGNLRKSYRKLCVAGFLHCDDWGQPLAKKEGRMLKQLALIGKAILKNLLN